MPIQQSNSDRVARQRVKSPRRWISGLLILLGFIIAFLLLSQNSVPVHSFSATTLTGQRVSLADYRGKVVMLNFWATWCPPCRAEMPGIESVYEQYRERGFTVLAVNIGERTDQVNNFVSQYGLTFPVLLDSSAVIQQQFGIKGYPTSLFLDANGTVYAVHPGAATSAQLANYIETGLKRSVQ